MDMELVELGSRIKVRRKQLGMNQQELAEAVGYKGKDMISRIESGQVNIPMDKVVEIAKALDMKVSELTGEQTVKVTSTPVLNHTINVEGLSDKSIRRLIEYVEILRRSEAWQQLSGTEEDGASESAKEEKSDLSHQRHQDDLEGVK